MRLLSVCALAVIAWAQTSPGPKVELSLVKPKAAYQIGERIPIRICFSAEEPGRYIADARTQDRIGRENWVEEYLIEPKSAVEDPLKGTGRENGGLGGIGGYSLLGPQPFCFDRDLNEYARFRSPGTFALRVRSHRVTPVRKDVKTPIPPGKAITLVTNEVRFRVVRARAEWQRARLQRAVAVLDSSQSGETAVAEARRDLRFLDTFDAGVEMIKHLTGLYEPFDFYLGITGSPFRDRLFTLLEQRLTDPDQAVGQWYIEALVQLWRTVGGGSAERSRAAEDGYLTRLAASLDRKRGVAQGLSVRTLLDYSVRYTYAPPPAWRASVVDFARRNFATFDRPVQEYLINSNWAALKNRALVPVLEKLFAAAGSNTSTFFLRRLYEVDPARGREVLIEDIRDGRRSIPAETLALLPALPADVVQLLIDRFQRGEGGDDAILRYAGPEFYPRIRAAFEKRLAAYATRGPWDCSWPLVFYFFKVDPAYGRETAERQVANPATKSSGCLDMGSGIRTLGPWAYSPALEQFAVSMLDSGVMVIKRGAADTLGWYGSPAVKDRLWATFEYWHNWWKDRKQDLETQPYGPENVGFEMTLRIALSRAANWRLTPAEWARLERLCVTDRCLAEVRDDLRKNGEPPDIHLLDSGFSTAFAAVGAYIAPTEEMFLAKIRQYPRGTLFVWNKEMPRNTPEDAATFEQWRPRFEQLGMRLEKPVLRVPGDSRTTS